MIVEKAASFGSKPAVLICLVRITVTPVTGAYHGGSLGGMPRGVHTDSYLEMEYATINGRLSQMPPVT